MKNIKHKPAIVFPFGFGLLAAFAFSILGCGSPDPDPKPASKTDSPVVEMDIPQSKKSASDKPKGKEKSTTEAPPAKSPTVDSLGSSSQDSPADKDFPADKDSPDDKESPADSDSGEDLEDSPGPSLNAPKSIEK